MDRYIDRHLAIQPDGEFVGRHTPFRNNSSNNNSSDNSSNNNNNSSNNSSNNNIRFR